MTPLGQAHRSLLYAPSVPAASIICWPSAVLAPTQANSLPLSRPFAVAIAVFAKSQLIDPFAMLSCAAISWCSRISVAFAPPFAPPPLPHALGLLWRMAQSWASESDEL